MKKQLTASLVALALLAFGAPAAQADDPVEIDILSVNDFHGRLEATPAATPPGAGAAVMAGMVDTFRADNPNVAFVGAGDFVGASTFTSYIQQDQPTIDALNAMGLDASAIGNHELDGGRADLDDRIIPAANWDYLAANLYDTTTGLPAYPDYSLKQFGDVTVAFIGAVTDELPSLVSPGGISTLTVKPVVPEVNRVADYLSDGDESNGEADVVVLLVHEGAAAPTLAAATDDSRFGQIVNGADANIDAIVSGHTHLAYDFDIPVPGTDKVRPVYSSGQYGEKFGHLSVSVDPASGDILSISAEVLGLPGYPADATVAQIVADAVAIAKVKGSVKVGDITADFNRAVTVGGAENRGGESTLGNFVADVQLWATQDKGTQIAFMNPGGLRADLKTAVNPTTPGDGPGVVTYQEAAGVQPFANTLVTMDLTGAQVKAVLEQQWQPTGASRPILHLGVSDSLTYTYDPAGAAGDRVRLIYVNGTLVAPTDVFTVVVNSFLSTGGDNFTAFIDGTNKADSGKVDLQSMVDYFVANPVATPDYEQRALGVALSAPDADGYSTGDSVALTLSSLLFSNDGPRAGTAVVSANGVELGSAAIDPTIVDTTDEVGRASVAFTLPPTDAGTLVLTVSVPETGTTIDVPITVTQVGVTNVTPPTITGQPRVGRTLTATGGTWSIDSPSLAYQWLRDGSPIEGATRATYQLVGADAGADVSVSVTASAPGYGAATAESTAVSVARVDSSVSGSLSTILVWGNRPVTYSVVVRGSNGIVPTGEVRVYDGGRLVTTATLGANGRVSIPLANLSRGLHTFTVRYVGSEQLTESRSWPSILLKL